jgi:large subunit ribosomal protein L23
MRGMGKRNDVRKAYVRLADGSEIDFLAAGE